MAGAAVGGEIAAEVIGGEIAADVVGGAAIDAVAAGAADAAIGAAGTDFALSGALSATDFAALDAGQLAGLQGGTDLGIGASGAFEGATTVAGGPAGIDFSALTPGQLNALGFDSGGAAFAGGNAVPTALPSAATGGGIFGITSGDALLGSGALNAVSSLTGGIISSSAAQKAAQLQSSAATTAAQAQLSQFAQTQTNLRPYMNAGTNSLAMLQLLTGTASPDTFNSLSTDQLAAMTPAQIAAIKSLNPLAAPLTAPFNPTQQQLEATPGYQFTKNQGLMAVGNQFAAGGLAGSGAATKGAISYAEGLAGTTFQQQLGNYLAQNQQTYNMLAGQVSSGQNAATNVGSIGLQTQTQANALTTGGAAAAAGGVVGSSNALSAGLTGAGNAASNTALLYSLENNGLFGKAA